MKKISILTLSIILNLQVIAQENYKKCLTTSLVEKELISNPDYAKSKANIISENKIWIKVVTDKFLIRGQLKGILHRVWA